MRISSHGFTIGVCVCLLVSNKWDLFVIVGVDINVKVWKDCGYVK